MKANGRRFATIGRSVLIAMGLEATSALLAAELDEELVPIVMATGRSA